MSTLTDRALGSAPPARAATPEVGPNALTQMVEPLRAAGGPALVTRVFRRAGLEAALADPPRSMVPQAHAQRLFRAVQSELPGAAATAVFTAAGRGTADYVMRHRIPSPVRWLLPRLPQRFASALLLGAIERHAWTFAGSGRCTTVARGREALITIRGNPLATAGCPWHTAVFSRMFGRLVSPRAQVRHDVCEARGEAACRFSIRLG